MAQNMLISYKEVFHAFGLLSLFLLIQKGNAYEFKVGGSGGWDVPNSNSYNEWAERSRFQIGDTLLFVYPADKDSVLYVSKEDYNNCNTESPLEKYTDGHTVFQFSHSGPYHFISGVKDNCQKNEKLIVVVMADRSNQTISAPSPSPSNETVTSPPPVPSEEVPPSPAPASEEAPPPPPTGSVEINPTPAPSQETPAPPPSGASSIVMSFIGSTGAFIASSLLFVF